VKNLPTFPLEIQNMNFSIASIFAGIVFGIIGVFVFKRGKDKGNIKGILLGLLLMLFPYFTPGAAWIDWVVGAGLSAVAYYFD
jgi:Na+/proline symporter